MKICLTCSPGGHLDELMSIMDAFKGHNIFFVTRPRARKLIGIQRIYYVKNLPKPMVLDIYIFSIIVHCVHLILPCIRILFKEKPDIIIGFGGEISLIMLYLGKLIGVRVIFIESLTRIHELSTGGILLLNIADLFLVQWSGLADKYKKAKYWGKVI